MGKIAASVILAVLTILCVFQARVFVIRKHQLEKDLAAISMELKTRENEYEKLEADYRYYLNPDNLEKELRAKFNYRHPEEGMIIIVPKTSSSTDNFKTNEDKQSDIQR